MKNILWILVTYFISLGSLFSLGNQEVDSLLIPPSDYQVLPVIWQASAGGGLWISELQITDTSGGSQVLVYYNYGGGNRRGPFLIWTGSTADSSAKFDNFLESLDAIDSGFDYYNTKGAVEFTTQDGSHKIRVATRTFNGEYSKTNQGLKDNNANTADITRSMMIQNLVENTSYRSSATFFNPSSDPVTVDFKLIDGDTGIQIGFTFSRTLVGFDYQGLLPFTEAGASGTFNHAILVITPSSGSGRVMSNGATVHKNSKDPAAHIAIQRAQGYDNSASSYQVLPLIWQASAGGGLWVTEIQITDISGGSEVSVYYNYGGGNQRGPFLIWTGTSSDSSLKFDNFLEWLDAADPGFDYSNTKGAVEFMTQDTAHRIHVTTRSRQGEYSKTVQGLNDNPANTADTSRSMMIQNLVENASYRTSTTFFNPSASSITVDFKLIDGDTGGQIGSTFSRTLVGYDYLAFLPFNEAGTSGTFDNAVLIITPASGSGRVMSNGSTVHKNSKDPAAHIAVQHQ